MMRVPSPSTPHRSKPAAVLLAAVAALTALTGPAMAGPGTPGQRPSFCGHDDRRSAGAEYLCAQAGDIVDVRIGDVHPTQPSLGYDEVYYKLGRYTLGKDAINKKFDDWCEASGLVAAAWATPASRLDDPASFGCELAPGQETDASRALMKTVVVGPGGSLYLTDGHHTLTSFYETPDGGPGTHVRLRVLGNLSQLPRQRFWAQMKANKWVWLQDVDGAPVSVNKLPTSLGLANFADDKYRSLLYFARDIGYSADGAIPFQEFYWGGWLRDTHPELAVWDAGDLDSYLGAVKAVTRAQVALPAGTPVYGGYTKEDLSAFDTWDPTGEFAKLARPYADKKPGKLAYALAYKARLGE